MGVLAALSWQCGGGCQFEFILSWATSAIASVVAQNTGGDKIHLMGNPMKNKMSGSYPGLAGRTIPNYLTLLELAQIL